MANRRRCCNCSGGECICLAELNSLSLSISMPSPATVEGRPSGGCDVILNPCTKCNSISGTYVLDFEDKSAIMGDDLDLPKCASCHPVSIDGKCWELFGCDSSEGFYQFCAPPSWDDSVDGCGTLIYLTISGTAPSITITLYIRYIQYKYFVSSGGGGVVLASGKVWTHIFGRIVSSCADIAGPMTYSSTVTETPISTKVGCNPGFFNGGYDPSLVDPCNTPSAIIEIL